MQRWLRKNGVTVELSTPTHINSRLLKIWEDVLIRNFHIIDFEKSGILFPYHFYSSVYGSETLLTSAQLNELSLKILNQKQGSSYFKLWVQKYIKGFLTKVFYMALIANILAIVAPNVRERLFAFYRRFRPR
ncbi:MAG: hypothetical protein ACK41T_10330 [Pseudobdellovibrio sp.]